MPSNQLSYYFRLEVPQQMPRQEVKFTLFLNTKYYYDGDEMTAII